MINKLNICNCRTHLVIPLAFDESMSYLEQLCAILHKLNETIDQVNYNSEFIEQYQSEYEKLQEQIDELRIEINNFEFRVNEEINNKFIELETRIIDLINNRFNALKIYVDDEVNKLQKQINDIETGKINVYDPTTGELSPIQIVINNIYDIGRTLAITCQEFDNLQLGSSEFDNYEITAIDFDTRAKELL